MNREVILIDDDYDQLLLPQQQQQVNPGTSRSRGTKRTFNGLTIQPVQNLQQLTANTLYSTSDGTILYQPPESVIIPATVPETIVGDSSDVFYIEELDEASGQITTMQIPVGGDQFQAVQDVGQAMYVHQAAYQEPVVIGGVVEDDDDDDEEPAAESIVPEEEVPAVDDYYEVEPLELSEIWNDLITANQEILILLELQDLKHHIVDARRIEDQLTAMTCDYCPKELPDVRAWNRHIKKIHFQTEIFDCDSCSARFKYYARFKDHLNSHSGQRPYSCDECDHHYATRIGFLVHKILEHMKLNGIYICPKCELDCKNAQNYKLHIAKHIDSVAPANGTSSASSAVVAPSTASVTSAPKTSQQPFRPFQAKANEQNKFLNVFENFSAKRNIGETSSVARSKAAKGRQHRI